MSSNKGLKLSYSSIKTFKDCPQKYFFSREWRSKKTSSAFPFGLAVESAATAMIKGKSLDEALEVFDKEWEPILKEDIDYYNSDLDLNLFGKDEEEQLKDWTVSIFGDKADWREELDNSIKSSANKANMRPKSLEYFNKASWLACAIRAELMLKAFHDEILPRIESVIKVEKKEGIQYKIRMENDDGDAIEGYPDFILKLKDVKNPVILDLKTASSFQYYDEHAIETSDQLKTYAAALWGLIGPVSVGYAVLIKRIGAKKSCSTCGHERPKGSRAENCKEKNCKGKYDDVDLYSDARLFIKDLEEAELDDILDEYMNIAVAIKNEVTFRNPNNCMSYGRQCEFYDVCWKGKKIEDIEDLEPKDKKK